MKRKPQGLYMKKWGKCGGEGNGIHSGTPKTTPGRALTISSRDSEGTEEKTFPICDQYALQGDAFSKAILEDTPVPTPLTDAIENMAVIDALFESASSSSWVTP